MYTCKFLNYKEQITNELKIFVSTTVNRKFPVNKQKTYTD